MCFLLKYYSSYVKAWKGIVSGTDLVRDMEDLDRPLPAPFQVNTESQQPWNLSRSTPTYIYNTTSMTIDFYWKQVSLQFFVD